jgi:phosphatidylglycerophosphate synthase
VSRAANPVAVELLIGLILLVSLLAATVAAVPSLGSGVWVSLGLFAALAALIWRARHSIPSRFGWPNRITLLRATLTAWLGVWVVDPGWFVDGSWTLVVASVGILLLDGLDGYLARRLDQSSRFGARFDMEVDAALILLLCVLILQSGRAGPWVLLIGLMRYAFVAAMLVLPWLERPLPERLRRKVICVWQVASLIVAFIPGLPGWFIVSALLAALILLIHSFALDTLWLYRHRPQNSFIERSGQ